jgi:hypothetical protein
MAIKINKLPCPSLMQSDKGTFPLVFVLTSHQIPLMKPSPVQKIFLETKRRRKMALLIPKSMKR